jgi:hypothetical protein
MVRVYTFTIGVAAFNALEFLAERKETPFKIKDFKKDVYGFTFSDSKFFGVLQNLLIKKLAIIEGNYNFIRITHEDNLTYYFRKEELKRAIKENAQIKINEDIIPALPLIREYFELTRMLSKKD